ncbi:hypothetical protein [Sporisorium scitamineum]|uniref:Uncharacterized protein n=1 Tax=Sporisorium scitamineum TaxID=49012 RepID=A0A0F7SDH1_9BASI|nr:hypothetical protein [Sporisorium scitamineum]
MSAPEKKQEADFTSESLRSKKSPEMPPISPRPPACCC